MLTVRGTAFRDLATTISRLSTQLGFAAPNGNLINTHDNERRKQTLKGLSSINMTLSNREYKFISSDVTRTILTRALSQHPGNRRILLIGYV